MNDRRALCVDVRAHRRKNRIYRRTDVASQNERGGNLPGKTVRIQRCKRNYNRRNRTWRMNQRSKNSADNNAYNNSPNSKTGEFLKEYHWTCIKGKRTFQKVKSPEQKSESHKNVGVIMNFPFFQEFHRKADSEYRNCNAWNTEIKAEKRNNPGGNCSSDVRAENNSDCLR